MRQRLYWWLGLAICLFALVLINTARAETLVYEGEFVVYAQGEFCAYKVGQKGCEYTLPAGVHKFVYADDGKTLIPEAMAFRKKEEPKLVPFEFGTDFDSCNSVADGQRNTCSHNLHLTIKSDPDVSKQWHLKAVHAPEAWQKVEAKPCIIAVIDTGVDCDHPDLKDSCLPGYNAITGEDNWHGTDGNGHGTHVAGTAASIRGNGVGGAGISSCKILPVKVLGDSGGGSLYTVMKGVEYVRRYSADVPVYSNMSLGSGGYSSSFDRAVQSLLQSGRPVIAAAGNEGRNNDLVPHYPSNFKGVTSVGATDNKGKRAYFSNYGKSVDITAPGVGIYATWPGGGHNAISGTSMATPIVAGATALLGRLPTGTQLDVLRDAEGRDGREETPDPPVRSPRTCKEKKLKSCFQKSCRRYKLYRRPRSWRACRKNCKATWCK